MKGGVENKKQLITAGVLGFFALFAMYFIYSQLFAGPTTPPPPPPVIVNASGNTGPARTFGASFAPGAAVKVGTSSVALDPTLHEEAMLVTESLVYSGTGRNIFASGSVALPPQPKKIEVAVFTPRPGPIVPVTPPPPPTCPPTCPPIGLKFFGTSTSASGVRRAFLLHGDDVFLAMTGDVVERKYRVVSITANSILIEDIPNVNKQTLPLVAN